MKKNRPEERNMRIVKVNKDSIANILSDLLKRSPTNYGDFQDKVDAIIKNVRDNGDKAVFDYTAQFDNCLLYTSCQEESTENWYRNASVSRRCRL